jgi:threonine/homoserine/homoserine lactone efflux protein
MEGATTAQIVYMVSIGAGMLAITHHTQWVVSTWAHVALMLLPWLAWARVKSHRLRADSRLAATPPIPEMSLTRVDHGPGRW